MITSHHQALVICYFTALILWAVIFKIYPDIWPRREAHNFSHPWREVGWALLAILVTLAIGQLYIRNWLLPSADSIRFLVDSFNQIIIFCPLLLLLFIRRHPLSSAWLPTDRIWIRILVGISLALIAILFFTLVRKGSDSWIVVVPQVYHPKNLPYLVQVFLEDIAVAILFVRFRSALGLWQTVVLVAVLFASGHIPALLAEGVAINELESLVLDSILAICVISIIQRSADIWWFWCIHFAMDMMQLYAVS